MPCCRIGVDMKRGKSTGKPTKAEQARLDAIHNMRCIACEVGEIALSCGRTEAHHLVDKGYRSHSGGHMATIPIGQWHHQGIPLPGFNEREMAFVFGPSRELSKRLFVERFGTDRELLAITNEKLARVAA